MNYQAPKIEWIDQNKLDENKVETEEWHRSNAQLLIERDLEDRVNKFAQIMLGKLIKKSRQGWNDWQNCHPDVFRKSLIEHIEKGDPIDVANIAFFLYQLKASTNKPIENLIDADVIQDEY